MHVQKNGKFSSIFTTSNFYSISPVICISKSNWTRWLVAVNEGEKKVDFIFYLFRLLVIFIHEIGFFLFFRLFFLSSLLWGMMVFLYEFNSIILNEKKVTQYNYLFVLSITLPKYRTLLRQI